MLIEDAQWLDPTSLELIELILGHIGTAPVLVLLTARPDFLPIFRDHPIVTRLALNRLGREDVARIVDRITGGKTLPANLVDEIVARTDGVPLYVEEMTKAVLESGLLRPTRIGWTLDGPTGPTQTLAIPTSLHD